MAELLVPISPGELIDKITILEIKSQRMTDAAKLHNVRTELSLLSDTWKASPFSATDISAEWAALMRRPAAFRCRRCAATTGNAAGRACRIAPM